MWRVALAIACAWAALACQHARQNLPDALLPESFVEYRVKRGDTLSRVAAWHGVEVEDVRRYNAIEGDRLAPGQVLRIPERPLASYALRPGDTLAKVGHWWGVDVEALIHLNDVRDVHRLPVGMVVRIPATAKRDGAALAARAHARGGAQRAAAARRPAAAGASSSTASALPAPRPVTRAPAAARAAAPTATAAAPRAEERPAPDRSAVERALAKAQAAYEEADFEAALEAAREAERLLTGFPLDASDRRRLARAHLLAGMANVALGREEDARRDFRSARAADPTIGLDPAQASPKIQIVFEQALTGEPGRATPVP
jgi:LysM repeat protein